MSSLPNPLAFRHRAIRHLAWICQAPQLFSGPLTFYPAKSVSAAALEKLRQWDLDPATGPSVLSDTPHRRLGLYFERLYACVATELLSWELLASNLPVRVAGATLGELDFLLRNPATGELEHHEIAVKYYLGYRREADGEVLWYGPNARDRLDIKTRRLLEHQSVLCQRAEAGAVLRSLGIRDVPIPRVFMPGYLFYPQANNLAAPSQAASDHARGHWLYVSEAENLDRSDWVHLRKPDWLGPHVQADAPDPGEAENAMSTVSASGRARLFAALRQDAQSGLWVEQARFFVVPQSWPELSS
ncbi:DUF1853 family protein [Proteobacteria bacterium 005FR1]|nr:DUF1853 family protein [Proteobacteria bacterium 005FR1]